MHSELEVVMTLRVEITPSLEVGALLALHQGRRAAWGDDVRFFMPQPSESSYAGQHLRFENAHYGT